MSDARPVADVNGDAGLPGAAPSAGSGVVGRSRSAGERAEAVPAIEVRGVTKIYEGALGPALDGVDLTVASGEVVAITGPSGCGKSTLLHLIAALDVPTAGTIVVHGQDLARLRDAKAFRREEVGLVFQLHNLLPRLSAIENVEIAMFGSPTTRAERARRARDLLSAVDLAGREKRRPTELSGGERQRVAIARALANEPAVLLADEPTGSLDSASVATVLDVFARLRADRGTTILLVTHDPSVAATADRVVTMRDGRIVGAAEASAPLMSR